jgi:hypothetical protein
MKLLSDRRIELNSSEYRMLAVLCGYLAPPSSVVSIAQLRGSINSVTCDPPAHDMAAFAFELLKDLLGDAEELIGRGTCH